MEERQSKRHFKQINMFYVEEILFPCAEAAIMFAISVREMINSGFPQWKVHYVTDDNGVGAETYVECFSEPLIAAMDVEILLSKFTPDQQRVLYVATLEGRGEAARLYRQHISENPNIGIRQAERCVDDLLDDFEALLLANDYMLFE